MAGIAAIALDRPDRFYVSSCPFPPDRFTGDMSYRGLPIEVGTETAIFTRAGVERIHRFAIELARKH